MNCGFFELIGIAGICLGGGYAVRAAVADPRVKAVAAMGGHEPYACYGTTRSFSPRWRNHVTRGSLHSLMTFDAMSAAEPPASTPVLIVYGETDAYCSPELARAFHERKPGEKEILWLDASQHTDLYDCEPYVTQAAKAVAGFLHRTLPPSAT